MSRAVAQSLDRTPPQNVELEMCVLGACMQEAAAYPIAAELLSPGDFYLDGHGLIFRLIGELQARGLKGDAVSLLDELRGRGLLEQVGGSGVLMGMLNSIPTAANVEDHARKIKDKSIARQLLAVAVASAERVYRQEDEPGEIIGGLQAALLKLDPRGRGPGAVGVGELAGQRLQALEAALEQRAALDGAGKRTQLVAGAGLSSGFYAWDNMLGGLRPGLHVLLGRASMGKSALALSVCLALAWHDAVPCGYLSFELQPNDLADRLLCMLAWHRDVPPVSTEMLRQGRLNAVQRGRIERAAGEMARMPLELDHGAGLRLGEVKARLRALVVKHGARLVVVDYLNRIRGDNRGDNRARELGDWCQQLRDSAYELGVPVLLLAQISRGEKNTKRRPEIDDARDSGEIEEAADTMTAVYRANYYDKDARKPGQLEDAELLVLKNNAGPTGAAHVMFVPEVARFLNPAPQSQQNGGGR